MRKRDTFDVLASAAAVVCDALAVFGGFALATWIRFVSEWISVPRGRPPDLWPTYLGGAALATLLFVFVFQGLHLFVRPQIGSFANKIPRLIRGAGIGVLLTVVLAFAVRNVVFDFSSMAIALALPAIAFLLVLERYILFRIERHYARRSRRTNRVLILGADPVGAHVRRTLGREPMFRSEVIGFVRTEADPLPPDIPDESVLGDLAALPELLQRETVNQIVLTNSRMGSDRMLEILLLCERNLITFNMVPDLFHLMTSSMDVQTLDDIPLLGIARWPLDRFWNRALKRIEDAVGSAFGLIVATPVVAVAAAAIKATSRGPVFYAQERCGENGRPFLLYKLRTMRADAEKDSGPVFTKPDDDRRTPVGAFLRRWNLDELPQLWNVMKGDMSLVGPRPERPHFVEKFKADISRYMWRHVSPPGLTGWAQVNGLRGDTSIEDRIRYDLYYLENWSLAFDFKILLKTLFANKNAY
jgi:exopolysaccharide biosynthesis polyprenyl glycosylphosphotransferase